MGIRTPTSFTGTITGQVGSLTTLLDAALGTLGWAIEFTATNRRVYRAAAGNRFRLRVHDDAPGAGGAREALVRPGEGATDVNTLVDAFPSVALVSDADCVWRKSSTADATTRDYHLVGDNRCFHLLINHAGPGDRSDLYSFGDAEPRWTGDNFATFFTTREAENSNAQALAGGATVSTTETNNSARLWWARNRSGSTKIERGVFIGFSTFMGLAPFQYPGPDSTSLKYQMKPVLIRANGGTLNPIVSGANERGGAPFLMDFLHSDAVTGMVLGDTWTDTAYSATSVFIIYSAFGPINQGNQSRWVLQTAGPWNPGF